VAGGIAPNWRSVRRPHNWRGPTADATEQFLESKTIGDQKVSVRRTRWDQPLEGARAAFVVESDGKRLHHILDAAATAGVLTIGEGKPSLPAAV